MAVAMRGAVIVSEYEDPYTNMVTYKQRCDNCGYVFSQTSHLHLDVAL